MVARALAREAMEIDRHYARIYAFLIANADRLKAMKRNEIFK
ncbi:hypothetical protein SAMN05216483_6639 [Streptomyces sp. 2131.1]|nr:hypothetical protein SAMN05216483_6639 [Streptomyces sp. 2131.1]